MNIGNLYFHIFRPARWITFSEMKWFNNILFYKDSLPVFRTRKKKNVEQMGFVGRMHSRHKIGMGLISFPTSSPNRLALLWKSYWLAKESRLIPLKRKFLWWKEKYEDDKRLKENSIENGFYRIII
jgi:hypothetical protein